MEVNNKALFCPRCNGKAVEKEFDTFEYPIKQTKGAKYEIMRKFLACMFSKVSCNNECVRRGNFMCKKCRLLFIDFSQDISWHVQLCYCGVKSHPYANNSMIKCGECILPSYFGDVNHLVDLSYKPLNSNNRIVSMALVELFRSFPQLIILDVNYDVLVPDDFHDPVNELVSSRNSVPYINFNSCYMLVLLNRIITSQNFKCVLCGLYFDGFPDVNTALSHIDKCKKKHI